MSRYKVILDRKASKLHYGNGELRVPLSPGSTIWKKLMGAVGVTKEQRMSDQARDALDTAYLIYVADRFLPRGERENWVRTIHLKLSLRSPESFRLIENDLKLTLNVLVADNFSFEVEKINSNEDRSPKFKERKKLMPKFTDVALISGGQDSGAGALELLSSKKNPLFVKVTLQDGSNKNEIQTMLRVASKKPVYLYAQPLLTPEEGKSSESEVESSQRLRSFFFLTLATTIAQTHEVNNVYINENGIMAIHLPLDPSRSSSFSTRTAYPYYLTTLENMFKKWLSYSEFKIHNLHVMKTKTEVIKGALPFNGRVFMKNAISCAHSSTVKRTFKRMKSQEKFIEGDPKDIHCGYCFPCILRRISMFNAGLENEDVSYVVDPFKMILEPESDRYDSFHEASSAVLNLIRFIREVDSSNELELCFSQPQIIESSKALGLKSPAPVVELHKRFVSEAKNYIQSRASYLMFLFDDQKSNQVQKTLSEISDEKVLFKTLKELGNYSPNEHFIKQVEDSYNQLRVYLQISLANGKVTSEDLEKSFKVFLKDSIPSPNRDGTEIQLKQNEGYELKNKMTKGCKTKCWPFNRAE